MALPHASAISLREAMEKMSGLPDLPGGARRRILVRALRVEEAPEVLRAIDMRADAWQGHNMKAVRQMANAYGLLRMLSLSALPARVDNPTTARAISPGYATARSSFGSAPIRWAAPSEPRPSPSATTYCITSTRQLTNP